MNFGPVFVGTEYVIEQKILTLGDTFRIEDRNGNLLAYVRRKIVSWGPQFYFETPDGTRLGEMRGKVLVSARIRPTFEIHDTQGLVARVKKKVLKLLGSEWLLEDASGNEIARGKESDAGWDFSIESPSGIQVALIHKKGVWWGGVRPGCYGIEILSQELNPYLIVAYAIAVDYVIFKPHGI